MKILHTFLIGFILILLVACSNPVETTAQHENLITLKPTFAQKPTITSTPSPSRTPVPTILTSTATSNPTQQTWHSTAIAFQRTKNAATQQAMEVKSTMITEFPVVDCDLSSFYGEISPNEEWIAGSCGYKRDQTLVVQNKEGIKWILEFNDFLHPSFSNAGMPGSLIPFFWSAEETYLYFTTSLGWSGGGDLCFPGYGTNGLFRLNLKTGSWVTLISPPQYFPEDEIKFSPTGRRYAIDLNGITINDLQTGEVIQISASGVIKFNWSPDGTNLAYSVASCNEEGFVASSSVYIWNALINQSRLIFTTEEILLSPSFWDDNSILRIEGEKLVEHNYQYTIYLFDISQETLFFYWNCYSPAIICVMA
jgi:hypothetical protein